MSITDLENIRRKKKLDAYIAESFEDIIIHTAMMENISAEFQDISLKPQKIDDITQALLELQEDTTNTLLCLLLELNYMRYIGTPAREAAIKDNSDDFDTYKFMKDSNVLEMAERNEQFDHTVLLPDFRIILTPEALERYIAQKISEGQELIGKIRVLIRHHIDNGQIAQCELKPEPTNLWLSDMMEDSFLNTYGRFLGLYITSNALAKTHIDRSNDPEYAIELLKDALDPEKSAIFPEERNETFLKHFSEEEIEEAKRQLAEETAEAPTQTKSQADVVIHLQPKSLTPPAP